ncbi:MAG TPA: glycosyltransferase family 87 protein [Anaerolineae bacterium]|nr:glycosyltransferase family 87 protein [Anaerolineae bacterium]
MKNRAWRDRLESRGAAIALTAAIIVTYLLLVYSVYQTFTSHVPGGNDFYPRWRGTRALLLEGKDPYSAEVTLQIQNDMYGRPAREGEDQVAFAYPLYVCFILVPFALLPYPVAQAFWSSALILTMLAALIILLRTLDWQPSPLGLIGLALWTVLFYPTARSVILGQISIVVLAFVALALWALKRGHGVLAGCLLALSTIKPQLIFLIVPFLLLMTVRWRNYRAVSAFLSVMALLLAVTSMALPGWIRSFVSGLTSYHSYTSIYRGGTSPIGFLVAALVPASLSGVVTLGVSLGLVTCVAYACYAAFTNRLQASAAFSIAIVATLLLPGETGTTNQVLLLLPLIWWLSELGRRRWAIGLFLAVLLAGPWLLFLCTIRGDLEHPVMVIPLPLATLLLISWHATSKTSRQLVAAASQIANPTQNR